MDLRKRFVEFARSFVETVESKINSHAKHLRGEDEDVQPSDVAQLISIASSVLPRGETVSAAIDYVSNKALRRKARKDACKLIEVIRFYERDKDKYRKILTQAAFDIFDSYLEGFLSVTTRKAGPLRAMQKLGIDAAFRLLEYLGGDIDRTDGFSVDTVTQGVLKGRSEGTSSVPWTYGRQLIVEGTGSTVRTSAFFSKLPTCFGMCVDKQNWSRGLGSRTLFPWEATTKQHFHQREVSISDQRDVFVEEVLNAMPKLNPSNDLKQYVTSTI